MSLARSVVRPLKCATHPHLLPRHHKTASKYLRYLDFSKIYTKKQPPSYLLSKNTCFCLYFMLQSTKNHWKPLKIVQTRMFFQWFCWFHRFQVFSLLASILADFSMMFKGFGSWNDCGGSHLLPLGLAWVELGTTFSFLGAILDSSIVNSWCLALSW